VQQTTHPDAELSKNQSAMQDRIGYWLVVSVGLWILLVSGALHVVTWTAEEKLLVLGWVLPAWVWFLIALGQSLLVGLAACPLSKYWPSERIRPVFNTWAICSFFVLILSPVRLIKPPNTQLANLLQIMLLSVFLVIIVLHSRRRNHEWRLSTFKPFAALWLAVAFGITVILPWLAWGALGSALDTALNLIAGMLFGLSVGILLSSYLLTPLRKSSNGIGQDLLLGGFAAGTAVVVMASSFGFNGLQIILMLFVPVLCVAIAGIGWFGQNRTKQSNWLAISLLVGIVVAAPMIFIDPDELVLLLAFSARDLPYWAFTAAIVSMIFASSFSVIFFLTRHYLSSAKPTVPFFALMVGTSVAGIFLFFGVGQSSFHGDQIFVIMKEQAELDGISALVDGEEKPKLIYDNLVNLAESSQADIRQDLDNLGLSYTPYYLVNGMVVDGGPVVGWWLGRRSDVDRVIENPILRPLPPSAVIRTGSSDAPSELPWNLSLIGADRVWREFGVTGEGIVVGHADSGVQKEHPELRAAYRGNTGGDDYNWLDPWFGKTSPYDESGHGTHTLGAILGKNIGVAPDAQWIGCANLVRGLGNPGLYLDCLQFLLAPFPNGGDPFSDGDPSLAAHVINNSWLCPEIEGCDEKTLVEAAMALREAGIFMVVSAGNEGPWCSSVRFPLATYDEVFSVGAINESGDLSSFSSLGPVDSDGSGRIKPDLVAPGENILSAFPGHTYMIQSGTSMAGPHVTGVVALMWSANSELIGDIDRTERILLETTTRYDGDMPDCVDNSIFPNNGSGYGILNAYEAVKAAIASP
jgi:hypothetical protein